jgi:hypothetical protein
MLLNPSQINSFSKIRNDMIEISGIARSNGGLIRSIPGSISSDIQTEEVYIEPYSQMATLALSWQYPNDQLYLELESPDGEIITISSAPGNVRPIYTDRPYMGFQIEQPVPGVWKLIVRPDRVTESASFHLFVFSQNPRIGGGIISTPRRYEPGDAIPLQFQSYFDRPITGLKVIGIATIGGKEVATIEFRDDENKDPSAGVAGNGLYSGSLENTLASGPYVIKVVAESDGKTTTYAGSHQPPGEENNYDYDPIPKFRRVYTKIISVGEEPVRRVEAEPNSGYPGQKLQATLKGSLTHFKQGYTSLDFGEGITVNHVQVKDHLTALVTLSIERAAPPGPRSITATTDKEIVKTEEGFQIVHPARKWSINPVIGILLLAGLLIIAIKLLMRGD